jgi:UDPglucose 6-dehydrogenase
MKYKCGVIGLGFVGGALFRGLSLSAEMRGYDIDERRATHTLEETVKESDHLFVAVPTPMESVEGGKADLSLIEKAIDSIVIWCDDSHTPTIIIKSTVPVGTTRMLQEKYAPFPILHSPEFLTERTANIDFIMPARNIIGGTDEDAMNKLEGLYEHRWPAVPCMKMGPEEAELVKYSANCFFATKIMFLNEIYMLVEKMGLDWDTVRNGLLADGRISHSHTDVPGHDGNLGYSGKCFPKDINALIAVFREKGLEALHLEACWEQNKRIRKNWDWADIKGAVSEGNT